MKRESDVEKKGVKGDGVTWTISQICLVTVSILLLHPTAAGGDFDSKMFHQDWTYSSQSFGNTLGLFSHKTLF